MRKKFLLWLRTYWESKARVNTTFFRSGVIDLLKGNENEPNKKRIYCNEK